MQLIVMPMKRIILLEINCEVDNDNNCDDNDDDDDCDSKL